MLVACTRRARAQGRRRSSSSRNGSFHGVGTTSAPTCRRPRSRCCTRARGSRSGRTIWRRSSRWSSSGRRCPRTPEIAIPDEVLELYTLWRPTPLYRARRLEQAIGTRSRIFYKYEGVSPPGSHKPNTAVAQAFYNKKEGPDAPLHRDRRGPMGQRARVRLQALRARVQGLHGSHLVRAEAVPALDDPGVGRRDRRQPVRGDAVRPRDPGGAPGFAGQPRHRDLGGGRGRGRTRRHGVLARQRPEPRAPAPDGDRPGGAGADGARRRVPGCGHRLRRRRLELRRPRLPVPAREDRRPRDRRPRLRAGRLPDADARALRLRLRRHGQADAARRRCTRSATTSSRRRSTPAACATTASRR